MGLLYWFNAYLNLLPFADTFVADGFQPMGKFTADDYWPVFVLWLKSMVFSPLGFVVNLVMIGACLMMGREVAAEVPSTDSRVWRVVISLGLGLVHAFVHVIAVYSLVFWLRAGRRRAALDRQPGCRRVGRRRPRHRGGRQRVHLRVAASAR